MKVSIIVAISSNHAIGKDNQLLWNIPEDLKKFKDTTMGHHMIMGRKTYESIGKPLPGRTTIVVTRNPDYEAEGCIVCHSLESAMAAANMAGEKEVFICGGSEIYNMSMEYADTIYLTRVMEMFYDADSFFPPIDYTKWTPRELVIDGSRTNVERHIFKNFPGRSHDWEYMILDKNK